MVGVCYRPPIPDCTLAHQLHDVLANVVSTYPECSLSLFDDFNFPSIVWPVPIQIYSKSECGHYIQVCIEFNLCQLVTSPTRVTPESSNVLELILTNTPEFYSDISCLDGLSDHKLLHLYVTFPSPTKCSSRKVIKNYAKVNYDAINASLTTFSQDFLFDYNSRTLEASWLLFKNKLTKKCSGELHGNPHPCA